MTNLLVSADGPSVTLSNAAPPSDAEAQRSPAYDAEPSVFSIPYLFAISNSRPVLVSSNEGSYVVRYSQTYTQGPLFWPGVSVIVALILFTVWKGVRKREE
ncbi:MAG TPA: hypothetical protein VM680_19720 [Verrucomicrobiae bacterium]|nr:hypothetical protein [Verrucomicrobiae bacterium]